MTLAASIVVPSYRGAERLPTLFAALQAQTCVSYECIVVIDGDLDGSAAVVATWSDRIPVRAIVLPENRGRSFALNAGHDAAQGGVLIRCDDDLRPGPTFVEEHLSSHAGGTVGVVGVCLDVFGDTASARAYGCQARDAMRRSGYALPADRVWRRWGANVSVSRATWEQVGPYDLRFTQYGWEDIDWGYRLHQLGVPILLRPELEVDHLNPAPTAGLRATKAYQSGESRAVFIDKHGSDVLNDSIPLDSVWHLAVRGVGTLMRSTRAVQRLSAPVDVLLPKLPPAVGRKCAALLIESAGAASLA